MCYEPRNEEFAKVCRERDEQQTELQNVIAKLHETESERDELSAALDGAKLCMKALNEKLVQVTAERDALFEEVRGYCHTCGKRNTDFDCEKKCYGHQRGSAWEWKGVAADHG